MQRGKRAVGLSAAALFAALTAACAQIQIPLPGVPVNMALFAVLLGAFVLGPRRSAWAAVAYLFMGICGVPVFSGFRAGPGVLFGPTGGFLMGYPLCSLAAGRLCGGADGSFLRRVFAGLLGVAVCSVPGVLWFMRCTDAQLTLSSLGWWLFYLPGDLLKIFLAALLARRLSVPARYIRL